MKRRKPAEVGIRISAQQSARLQQAVNAHSAGQLAIAEPAYRALVAEDVKSPELHCNLALICAQSGRRNEADVFWKKALAIDPRSIEARMNLADSYQLAGDIARASKMYRRVIADHKSYYIAKYMLANLLKSQGKIGEASGLYQRVMAQEPGYTQAHFSYSGIHKYQQRSDSHIDSMLGLYQKAGLSDENRTQLAFALAKAFEDLGDFEQAFHYLDTGNAIRSEEFAYDIEGDKALFASIIETFTADALSALGVNTESSDRPIFIVGMPRSGTSLVEKILSSHTDVYGAGELEYMFALGTSRFLGKLNNFKFRALDSYSRELFAEVGQVYLEQISLLNDDAGHVTDKMPFNMMMVGLIRIALPNAKIVHCVRDARDTCLSIFKQNFTTGNYRFAYNLRTVAQFHNLYRELMQHWHETMGGVIYDISYETLTQNPEHEIRQLLSACNLEFQEDCLNFDRTKAVVKTASAYQVRQPMYTSSVGLWKQYRNFLRPMLDELQAD